MLVSQQALLTVALLGASALAHSAVRNKATECPECSVSHGWVIFHPGTHTASFLTLHVPSLSWVRPQFMISNHRLSSFKKFSVETEM